MSIIAQTTDAVTTARAALDQVQALIADALAMRESLLGQCQSELARAGVEAVITRRTFPHHATREIRRGDVWWVRETLELVDGRTFRRLEGIDRTDVPAKFRGVRADTTFNTLYIDRGYHRVLLVDRVPDGAYGPTYDVLLAPVDSEDTETAHRRSISRLRNLFRHDDIRVRVRDRDIDLIDPLDNIVHTGDIITAFAFTLNIDLENAEAPA